MQSLSSATRTAPIGIVRRDKRSSRACTPRRPNPADQHALHGGQGRDQVPGIGYFPTIRLNELAVDELRLRRDEIKLEQARILEATPISTVSASAFSVDGDWFGDLFGGGTETKISVDQIGRRALKKSSKR